MLTAEQIEIRSTGIGASELASVVDVHPYQGPLHVWLRKPTPTRGALLPHDAMEDPLSATAVGSILEDGMRQLFEKKTKLKLVRPGPITLRHDRFPCVLASPDDLVANDHDGLEIKVVGINSAHLWAQGLPDHHELQCRQNMSVTGRARWYVIALIGGIDVRLHCVERDLEIEDCMLEAASQFWDDYVLGDEPPAPRDESERAKYLRYRYPGGTDKTIVDAYNDAEVGALLRTLADAKAAISMAEACALKAENDLIERLAGQYGFAGDVGKYLRFAKRGNPNWKAIAEELAGGVVSDALIEKHRGTTTPVGVFYPKKDKGR